MLKRIRQHQFDDPRSRAIDLSGQEFNRWRVVEPIDAIGGRMRWRVKHLLTPGCTTAIYAGWRLQKGQVSKHCPGCEHLRVNEKNTPVPKPGPKLGVKVGPRKKPAVDHGRPPMCFKCFGLPHRVTGKRCSGCKLERSDV